MTIFASRTSIGLSVVGEDLLVVEASLRGEQARWAATRVAGFFAEQGAAEGSVPAIGRSRAVTLVWPTHRMLRRDAALGEQTIESLRDAVREAPDAFFPVARDEGLLWDAHEYVDAEGVRRAMLFGVRLPEVEPALNRLAQAGVTPTRLVPCGAAWSVLRLTSDEAPSSVLDIGPKAWSASDYDGLRWIGVRSGFGAAPADLRDRARREGWGVCDWRTPPAVVGQSSAWRPDELTPDHAALGGALLDLARDADTVSAGLPSIDLLATPAKRSLRIGPLGWFAAACAAAVVGLLVWNDAAGARAAREARTIAAEVDRLRPSVERVETLRAQGEAILSAHERLAKLESSYRSMTRTLAELARVVPDDSHLPKIDFADSGMSVDAVAPSRTALMTAIQNSPMFEGIAQTTGGTPLPTGGEQFGVAFGFERGAGAPAPASAGGGS